LPLHGDLGRIVAYLALDEAARETERVCLCARATTLQAALNRPVPFAEAAACLAEGFAQALNLTLEEGELTGREREAAVLLCRTRYASPDWTKRVG